MDKQKQIEEMAKIMCTKTYARCSNCSCEVPTACNIYKYAVKLFYANYRKIPEGSVVVSKEEYEKLKSLYDSQQGAIMTSSIGDLPLTIEGLRKAVDEITRLNKVETELQELNIKYYNEAKDLRRKLKDAQEFWKASVFTEKEARKQAVKEMLEKISNTPIKLSYGLDAKTVNIMTATLKDKMDEIAKEMGVEL